MNIYR